MANRKKKKLQYKQGKCCYCETPLNKWNFSKEHVWPKHLGGRYVKPACMYCNGDKRGMTPVEYIRYLKNKKSKLIKDRVRIKNVRIVWAELWNYLLT